MRRREFLWLGLAAAGVGSAGAASWRAFAAETARARFHTHLGSLPIGSTVFESRFGPMEYAVAGDGPPCIMIHGTGGGFDQGIFFAAPLIAAGWQIIAPSRFGYLRSAFPEDASSENQADAIVDLMDKLSIESAPIIAGSAGTLSAMQFAIRHPDRCSGLVCVVPVAHVPDRPAPQPPSLVARAIIEYGLRSDFLFWLGLMTSERAMIRSLLATVPTLVDAASPEEQARVRSILWGIQPVSLRADGLLNDAELAGNPAPMELERIVSPTFVASLEDDFFETAAPARHIAASLPDTELVIYPSGGHVWVGRNKDLFSRIHRFLGTL